MLYRIDADSAETLSEVMKKLNTTKAGFQVYWYAFDYFAKSACDKILRNEGYFVDLDENCHDLAVMADILTDYVITVKDGWTKNRGDFGTPSIEDDEYFNAIPLYIVEKEDVKQ